jgi:hypothetical protein
VWFESLELDGDAPINKVNQRRYLVCDGIPVPLNENDFGPQNGKIEEMYQWMAKGYDLALAVGNLLPLGGITRLRPQSASGMGLKPASHTKICF